jgi:RTX calcium-binding nonapeptide repeat (4 copies)
MPESAPIGRAVRVTKTFVLLLAVATLSLVLELEGTARGATGISVVGGQLVIRAAGPELNVVDVRKSGFGYVVFNGTSELTAGDGCVVTSEISVRCDALVLSVNAVGGEASDLIGLREVDVPVVAEGGPGDDDIHGGTGPNSLKGGDGLDQLVGGGVADQVDGGPDDDLLVGGASSDTALGGPGNDILRGGSGDNDVLRGEEGQDLVLGGHGADLLDGGSDDDVLVGGSDQDSIAPGSGANRILGRFDVVACGPDDQAGGGRIHGCAPLEGNGAPPSAWPPKGSPVSATTLPPASAWPRARGHASSVTVHIPARRARRVRICIHTYDRYVRRLDRYPATVLTRFYPNVTRPRPSRVAWSATARRTRHCPRTRY